MRSFFGAIEDWNSTDDRDSGLSIAIVLRGDRGLEQMLLGTFSDQNIAIVLRGDRGLELYFRRRPLSIMEIAIVLRGDRGLEQPGTVALLLRSSFEIAIVLRGDRGLEL